MEVRILRQEPIGPTQVKEILGDIEKKLKKSKESLGRSQQRVMDSIIKFSKLNKEKETKLIKDLKALDIPRLSDSHIAQIVTIIPKDVDELRTVFAGSKTTITKEDLEKIQSTIKQYEK